MSRKVAKALVSLAAIAAFALLATSPAAASTASISGDELRYTAVNGETNDVTISLEGANYILDDPGAIITPGLHCVAVNVSRVSCVAAEATYQSVVELRDMDDRATLAESFVPPPFGVTIEGEGGNDTITNLSSYSMRALGDTGNDTLSGGPIRDRLEGEDGGDTLVGSDGDDQLIPGDGDDTVEGGPGNDQMESEGAADGADSFAGGSGFDFVAYYNRKLPVSISFDGVANDGEAGEGDNVGADVEGAGGGDGDDTLIGSDEANQLDGSRGDDTVSGGGGDDDINGDDGDDTVSGGAGNDSVEGDDGGDTIAGDDGDDTFNSEFFDGRADQISGGGGIDGYSDDSILGLTISLDGVADDGYRDPAEGPAIDNVGADVENLAVASFGGADDILIGNASANRIEGGPGDDRIEGLGGPDTVIGGSGDDDLDGGNGIDAIEGESGSDRIRSRDSKPDEIGCGSDVDVLLADSLDQFSVTCDSSSTGPLLKSSRAKLSRQGKGKVKVSCPQAEGIDCRVKLKVRKGKKTVARGSGRVKSGKSKKLTLKLTKAGRKANGKKLKGRATTGMTDAAGSNAATSRSLVLTKR